jgi:sugar/nucleoside kinase (ribokinase family)
MRQHQRTVRSLTGAAIALVLAASLLGADAAFAANDSCREWLKEHCRWKAETMRLYLRGEPQREIDAAIFEMLQREAYLTSCEVTVQGSRDAMVGWRLVGRMPDDYAGAVLEAVLERAGFDMDLSSVTPEAFEPPTDPYHELERSIHASNATVAGSLNTRRRVAGDSR